MQKRENANILEQAALALSEVAALPSGCIPRDPLAQLRREWQKIERIHLTGSTSVAATPNKRAAASDLATLTLLELPVRHWHAALALRTSTSWLRTTDSLNPPTAAGGAALRPAEAVCRGPGAHGGDLRAVPWQVRARRGV